MTLKYVGKGEAILGFPARDLSDEEVLKYAKKFLVQNASYEEVKEEQKPPPSTKKSGKESEQ